MKARLFAFVIWAAVAASAIFWLLRLGASSPVAPAHTVSVSAATPPRGDLTRLFGAAPVAPVGGPQTPAPSPLSSRFKLLGVAAPRQGGERNGLALIAVDGKPARSYAVGAAVEGDLLLQSVHARGARLGTRGAPPQVTLDLPALPLAATGSLPQAPFGGPPGATPLPGMPPGMAGAALSSLPAPPATESNNAEPVPVPPPPGNSSTR
jgi:general secretion pathway protein C